jgi:hypothetical protein
MFILSLLTSIIADLNRHTFFEEETKEEGKKKLQRFFYLSLNRQDKMITY